MAETTQSSLIDRVFDRAWLARLADGLAIAVAAALPWSTSVTAILLVLWLLALLPTLDLAAFRKSLVLPAAAFPVALCALGVLGMAWADVPFAERIESVKVFVRLLAIPLLFVQFSRSDRGCWVIGAFVASCSSLLILSWATGIWPSLAWRSSTIAPPGVPVKDYIVQSGEFLICAFGLAHLAIDNWRAGRPGWSLALGALALVFVANIVFVATGRSTLVVFAVLLFALAVQRFSWKGATAIVVAGAILGAAAWETSPYLRTRVMAVFDEVATYQSENAKTSSGYRLEFWKKSLQFVAAAPLFGHGTGSVRELFRQAAIGEQGVSSEVTDNPHNQTFVIAIQLGLVGVALLYAMWVSHLLLFRGAGLAAWLGSGVVIQNIVSCLFNSYIFEFTLGWLYVFGVGVLGGMILRRKRPLTAAGAP